MKKKIVLITAGQPSINPRLVKEADSLANAGYDVAVIYQYWNEWATNADIVLLEHKLWKAIRVGGSPTESKFIYFVTRMIHRVFRFLFQKMGTKFFIPEIASCRTSILLLMKALQLRADLYVGHTPGTLAIAALAAKRRHVKCGFDAEDFHRHEYTDDMNHPDAKMKIYLEEEYFPKYDYLLTASPLITEEYLKHFPKLNFQTILNVFPKAAEKKAIISEAEKPLKLFWFSQTVGHNRGLEDIVKAMHHCNSKLLELHILGYPREKVIAGIHQLASEFRFSASQIHFYNPVPPDEIFELAARFDVGMATEIGNPYNRDICLTNKIFTYLQSGLAIIASDTSSQISLIKEDPNIGFIYQKKNPKSLGTQIKKLLEDRALLNSIKNHNFNLGQTKFNWDKESFQFMKIISGALSE